MFTLKIDMKRLNDKLWENYIIENSFDCFANYLYICIVVVGIIKRKYVFQIRCEISNAFFRFDSINCLSNMIRWHSVLSMWNIFDSLQLKRYLYMNSKSWYDLHTFETDIESSATLGDILWFSYEIKFIKTSNES